MEGSLTCCFKYNVLFLVVVMVDHHLCALARACWCVDAWESAHARACTWMRARVVCIRVRVRTCTSTQHPVFTLVLCFPRNYRKAKYSLWTETVTEKWSCSFSFKFRYHHWSVFVAETPFPLAITLVVVCRKLREIYNREGQKEF